MNKDVIVSIIGNHLMNKTQLRLFPEESFIHGMEKPMLRIMNLIMKTILLTV